VLSELEKKQDSKLTDQILSLRSQLEDTVAGRTQSLEKSTTF